MLRCSKSNSFVNNKLKDSSLRLHKKKNQSWRTISQVVWLVSDLADSMTRPMLWVEGSTWTKSRTSSTRWTSIRWSRNLPKNTCTPSTSITYDISWIHTWGDLSRRPSLPTQKSLSSPSKRTWTKQSNQPIQSTLRSKIGERTRKKYFQTLLRVCSKVG